MELSFLGVVALTLTLIGSRIRQLFSNLLALDTEGCVGGRFQAMRLDRLLATEASTVSAFSDPGQCVVDASGFAEVPACQTVEQVASAFIRCSIDPLFVVLHRVVPYEHAQASA
jgi:hypothetical protein